MVWFHIKVWYHIAHDIIGKYDITFVCQTMISWPKSMISYMISCKLWYCMMISCTWNMKLQASWYPWYVLQNHDIIYDIIETYEIITWYHSAPGFLVPLISPKIHEILWNIGKNHDVMSSWNHGFYDIMSSWNHASFYDVRAWFHFFWCKGMISRAQFQNMISWSWHKF